MGFRIEGEESIADSLRRIAVEQIDEAAAEIEDPNLDRHKAVHQVRRRFKKLRGVLRLGRDAFPKIYSRDNAAIRDASGKLAPFRDAQSAIEAFDAFRKRYRAELAGEELPRLRARLVEVQQETAPGDDELGRRLTETLESLRDFRGRFEAWQLKDDGFSAVASGLARLYSQGVERMEAAYKLDKRSPFDPETTVAFHEWRKRVKYLGFGLRILTPIWKDSLDVHRTAADRIEGKLGEEHDLALLCERFRTERETSDFAAEADRFLPLAERRRKELRDAVRPLGRRFYAEATEDFVRRLRRYWKVRKRSLGQPAEPQLG